MFRIIKSLIVVIIVASVASGASFGYFSDSESSLGNVFTAGTVEVDAIQGSGAIDVSGLSKGQCRSGEITAENRGSLPAYFWLDMASHNGNALMWDNLLLFVSDNDSGDNIYGGLMKNFEKVRISDALYSATEPVPPGETQTISYAVCMPCFPADLQGKNLDWTLEITASSGSDDFVSAPFSGGFRPNCGGGHL